MSADETPAALGYRWPAEWEPHAATWLAWPHNRDTWPGKFEPIPAQFTRLVEAIAGCEPVQVLAGGDTALREARRWIGDLPRVGLLDIETNDAWCRDHGPTFLVGPPQLPPALIDWDYNAWGGKYPPFDKDNDLPRQIAERTGRRRFVPRMVLEGGAIDGDGRGTLLATESCLLSPNRNPGWTRLQVEHCLAAYVGAEKILWLPRGELAGDDTDGHTDQLARFVAPAVVVAGVSDNTLDENFEPLRENYEWLARATDRGGNRLEVVPLPLPAPKFFEQHRLPASYCNFYIANRLVVVPQFGDDADGRALKTLEQLFPDRQVIGLPALDLVWGLGAFHCLTQQEPA